MKKHALLLGCNLINTRKIVSVSWCVVSPEENSGVPLVCWIKIIFENTHCPLEITGDYETIRQYMNVLREAMSA